MRKLTVVADSIEALESEIHRVRDSLEIVADDPAATATKKKRLIDLGERLRKAKEQHKVELETEGSADAVEHYNQQETLEEHAMDYAATAIARLKTVAAAKAKIRASKTKPKTKAKTKVKTKAAPHGVLDSNSSYAKEAARNAKLTSQTPVVKKFLGGSVEYVMSKNLSQHTGEEGTDFENNVVEVKRVAGGFEVTFSVGRKKVTTYKKDMPLVDSLKAAAKQFDQKYLAK